MDEVVASIARRELGTTPDEVRRIDEGLLHETYAIRCDDGEYVLQFSVAGGDPDDSLRRGLNCYRFLQDSGIPVPRVVTEDVRELDGRQYAIVEKLPGESAKLDISPEKVRTAGRYLAKIHGVASFDASGRIRFDDGRPTVDPYEDGSLAARIRREVDERTRALREAGGELATAGTEVASLFERVGDRIPGEFRPVFCHGDFSPDNVLYRDGEVTGVLDFDRACAGHAQRDLVQSGNGFWMHDPGVDWNVRATLYDGYRDVRGLADAFDRNERLYRVETLTWVVAALYEMGELSEYEQSFYAERILEATDRVDGASEN